MGLAQRGTMRSAASHHTPSPFRQQLSIMRGAREANFSARSLNCMVLSLAKIFEFSSA